MTQEEIRKRLEGYFAWAGARERPATAWYASLEQWAQQEFNYHYDVENPKEKK